MATDTLKALFRADPRESVATRAKIFRGEALQPGGTRGL
jgi:hypothetical protein